MNMKCAALNCRSSHRPNRQDIELITSWVQSRTKKHPFKFPKKPDRHARWVTALRRRRRSSVPGRRSAITGRKTQILTGGAPSPIGGATLLTGEASSPVGGAPLLTGGAPPPVGGALLLIGEAPSAARGAWLLAGGASSPVGGAQLLTGGVPSPTEEASLLTGGAPSPAEERSYWQLQLQLGAHGRRHRLNEPHSLPEDRHYWLFGRFLWMQGHATSRVVIDSCWITLASDAALPPQTAWATESQRKVLTGHALNALYWVRYYGQQLLASNLPRKVFVEVVSRLGSEDAQLTGTVICLQGRSTTGLQKRMAGALSNLFAGNMVRDMNTEQCCAC